MLGPLMLTINMQTLFGWLPRFWIWSTCPDVVRKFIKCKQQKFPNLQFKSNILRGRMGKDVRTTAEKFSMKYSFRKTRFMSH